MRATAQPDTGPRGGGAPAAGGQAGEEMTDPEGPTIHRRRPEGGGKTEKQKRPRHDPTDSGRKDTITKRRRSDDRAPEDGTTLLQARAGGAGIPPQELSVGGEALPERP